MKRRIGMFFIAMLGAGLIQAQPSWKKIKKESFPEDYKKYKLLLEQFEYQDPEDLDAEASLGNYAFDKKAEGSETTDGVDADVKYDYEKRDMIKQKMEETNENLSKYNDLLRAAVDSSHIAHHVVGKAVAEGNDTATFDKDTYRYVIRHKYVYYRSSSTYSGGIHVPAGYNIAFYVYDRRTDKSYPPIRIHYKDLGYTIEKIAEKMAKEK